MLRISREYIRDSGRNFSKEDIVEGIKYAHIRGCKVYVTINTLAYDEELDRTTCRILRVL